MSICRARAATPSVALVVLLSLVSFAAAPSGGTQPRKLMTVIDLMEVPRLLDPQLSPDGLRLLYTLNRADWKANRRIGHIWLQRIRGGPPLQLTFGDGGEASVRWSPDGTTILFLTRRAADTDVQIYLMAADGGEARVLTHHATSVSQPAWSPDGSSIYFLALDAKAADERKRDGLRDDVFAFEENYKQRHLWKVSVGSGAEQKLTTGDSSVTAYRLSHDGRRIAFHRAPSPLVGDDFRSEVWVMDATGEHATALTHNAVEETDAELSPDNSQLLFLGACNERFESPYNNGLFVMPAAGGDPQLLLPDFPYEMLKAGWADDGRTIFAVVNMGIHSEIFRIDVRSRTFKQLTDGQHAIPAAPGTWSIQAEAGQMVFQFDEAARLGDVWTLPLAGGAPTRVTGVFDALDRDFRLPRQEGITWKSADGTTIEGLLMYPIDFEPGKRYPLVVQIHGGPHDSDRFGFWADQTSYVSVWTAKGYAVLRPNYRGSSGYSNAFLRDLVGGYFRNQHLDVIAGVDALVKQGMVDPDRVGVMGFSAGAHLVNKLITYTDRFKAAASAAGAANWISMYAQTDGRAPWRTSWFGDTPWEKGAPIETYWNNSPLKDVSNVKTPTIFLVGENDVRVPMPQSVEMYRGLRANAVPTHLYVAPREPHQWFELRHQLFKMNTELEWFETYVTGRPYVQERAPGDADDGKFKSSHH